MAVYEEAFHTDDSADFLQSSPHQLDNFIAMHLQPTEEYNRFAGDVIHRLVLFLQHQTGYSVDRVIKAGSFGKGTQVKGYADLDCILVMNNLKGAEDVKNQCWAISSKLADLLKQSTWAETISIGPITRFSASFSVKVAGEDMALDLLPTFNAMGHNPSQSKKASVYEQIMALPDDDKRFWSAALGQLKVEFVGNQPARVKNLIRLVKYWRYQVVKKKADEGLRYPASYPMELITIYVWEKAGKPPRFGMAEAFKAVLQHLANYASLDIAWVDNYDARIASRAKRTMSRPILLDPSNPTNNVFSAYSSRSWEHVSRLANSTMQTPLLQSVRSLPMVR